MGHKPCKRLPCALILHVHAGAQSGTKLLFAEIKIALRLINKALHGHTLTRSDHGVSSIPTHALQLAQCICV